GLFQYGAAVPLPDAPPRPDLDPSLVVTRAPHPGAAEAFVAEAAPAPSYDEDELAYDEMAAESEASDYAEPASESGEYEAAAPEVAEVEDEEAELEPELELEAEGRD